MLSDADLVERSRPRDAQAFGSLVERHHRLVFGVAFAKCRDATLAEDVAQEAYVVAWSDLGRLRDADRVGPWIAGIARNLAVSAARDRARSAELPDLAVACGLGRGAAGACRGCMSDRECCSGTCKPNLSCM